MFLMLGGVLLLVAILALGFYLHVRALIAAAPKPTPQTVSATAVVALEWQPRLAAVGSTSAVRGVDVTTELAGMVRSIHFESGQEVTAGAVLIQLNVDADVAQLHSLQAAADLAAIVLERDQAQFDVSAVSQSLIDSDIADLKGKRALVEQQAALIEKKTVRAPFAGKLGITTVNPGQYLNAGDTIVTLQSLDPIYVDFNVPQIQIGAVSMSQEVSLAVDGFPGHDFPGRISAISPKVDAATRNLQVQATLPNAAHQLLPGMFANVNVNIGDKVKRLTLPQTAIIYNAYGSAVYVVTPAKAGGPPGLVAQQVFVTTGDKRGDQIAILSGLQAGQQVVTSGQLKLKNGAPVVIDNSVQPANSPNPRPQEH